MYMIKEFLSPHQVNKQIADANSRVSHSHTDRRWDEGGGGCGRGLDSRRTVDGVGGEGG